MIPAYFPESSPPGEKALYSALAGCEGTDGWTVLHSVGIADHIKNPQGEADFVVVVPEQGVLVIEVKSHLTVEYRDGVWHLGRDKPTMRGPFRQASDAKFSLRNFLQRKQIDVSSLPVVSAAWFTAVRARASLGSSPEWHVWEVLDSQDLRTGVKAAVLRTLAAGRAHLEATVSGFVSGGGRPDAATAQRICAALRPTFEFGVVAGDLRRAREDQLVHFIAEQFDALDAMADNRAVLFTGPAGSGKTLLAMEAARREIEMGYSGRLICFNRFLGQRLAADMPGNERLVVGTLHQQMLRVAGISAPAGVDTDFWTEELPSLAVEAIAEAGDQAAADFLVVDEIQDVACEGYLDVLDLMLKGGLERGRLLLFGDFERQAIYEGADGRQLLRDRVPRLTSSRLGYNCRNLPRIGYIVNRFSGLKPGYERFRRADDGTNPEWRTYRAGADQTPKLLDAIHTLRDENYELHEIVVLSPLAEGSVAASTTDGWLRQVLRPADGRPRKRGELQFSTIQAFKGLEAPAVVVTDLDRTVVPNFDSVMYVGLTRATDRLWGVIEEGTLRAGLEGTL
ncbi:NERD domain-containing protein [Labedaea rhizosphaerae]|uniref:AAA domain-containing protein n=1 Tax=Labedaea rhizosphaerae TaxID=598644 RepID=A0A4R6RSA1_LABRH|nr:NERD domain-containing protein [Labedaea rhizosphaerae]TDP89604.1 AAA domain-containing protein [Labedaea rhizosphaerae]